MAPVARPHEDETRTAPVAVQPTPVPTTAHPATSVAQEPKREFNDGFTLQGISIIVGLVIATLTIITFFINMRTRGEVAAEKRDEKLQKEFRERSGELKDEVTKHNDDFGKRLATVEATVKDFMPRTEIEKLIEHERTNRVQSQNYLKDQHAKMAEDISDIKIQLGRAEVHRDTTTQTLGKMEGLMEKMAQQIQEMSGDLRAHVAKG